MFLFCAEGTWHCMCHFAYFFIVAHITNAKVYDMENDTSLDPV